MKVVFIAIPTIFIGGCASYPNWIAKSGPSVKQIVEVPVPGSAVIRLLNIDDSLARRLMELEKSPLFSEVFQTSQLPTHLVGPGDMLEVSVWEAPPAVLFGTTVFDARSGSATARVTTFPEQMISSEGTINVPFAGTVLASNRSPHQLEVEIAGRLRGKANSPQVLVRVTRNATSTVTVVGEVTQSVRMPLTAKGERLLDAIASAGGVRQPVNKVTVQLTRGSVLQALPLDRVIRDPRENVVLRAGDVITLLFQPLSFTVLGATSKNEEVNFEAQGISLSQALARAGGLQDARSDIKGVFVFRFEDPRAINDSPNTGPVTPEGKIPIVYQLNLADPSSFLSAQNFPMRNKDVIYVANAPAVEFQKFLNMVTTSILSAASLINVTK